MSVGHLFAPHVIDWLLWLAPQGNFEGDNLFSPERIVISAESILTLKNRELIHFG